MHSVAQVRSRGFRRRLRHMARRYLDTPEERWYEGVVFRMSPLARLPLR